MRILLGEVTLQPPKPRSYDLRISGTLWKAISKEHRASLVNVSQNPVVFTKVSTSLCSRGIDFWGRFYVLTDSWGDKAGLFIRKLDHFCSAEAREEEIKGGSVRVVEPFQNRIALFYTANPSQPL